MPPHSIYLDHNATAPILPEVADAMRDAALRFPGNPASQHEPGRRARRALEAARIRIGELLDAQMHGMDADQVILTSGGTESNNLALHGLLRQAGTSPSPAPRLIISPIEHPSIARTAEHLATRGVHVEQVAVNKDGLVRIDDLRRILAEHAQLVSVMLANNETGVLQPLREIAALCRESHTLLHTDATQAVGKIPVHFRDLGVHALTATAHKFHGPLGIGVLFLRHGTPLASSLHGGFQQSALRPGTESVALAIGMQTALEAWHREATERFNHMSSLRDKFEQTLLAGELNAVLVGSEAPRLPHASNIAFVGLDRQALVMALDLAGVACSSGSACASGSSEPSPTLLAMSLPPEQISSSIRFSLGATTTAADIDEAARRILAVGNQLRRQK
jgi:cysteine desulfurase